MIRVMMSLQTAELVLFDDEENELIFQLLSPQSETMVDFVIGVEDNAHVLEFLEELSEL